jgi:tetratricopeptide (TPR) repeat protein
LRIWRWSAPAHLLAARIERLDQQFISAAQYLDLCEHLSTPNERTQLERLFLRADTGELYELEDTLREAVNNDSAHKIEILETLIEANLREQRWMQARWAVNRLLELDRNSSRGWFWAGVLQERRRMLDEAIAAYKRSLELNPNRYNAAERVIDLLLTEKRATDALPYIQLLLERDPRRTSGRVGLAAYHIARGDGDDQARPILDELLREQPDLVAALLQRGKLACNTNQPAEGEGDLRRAAELQPHDSGILFAYQQCLQQLGKAAEAIKVRQEYETVLRQRDRLEQKLSPGNEHSYKDPAFLCEVAGLLMGLDRSEQGVEWYYRALRYDPNCILAHRALAEYYQTHGDAERAEEHRNRLTRLEEKNRTSPPTTAPPPH